MAGNSIADGHLIIILATIIPCAVLLVVGIILYRVLRRRKAPFPSRGITPIGDEEIESWKVDKTKSATTDDEDEKRIRSPVCDSKSSHQSNTSVGSVHKPPSLIIYQNHSGGRRASDDHQTSPWSPPFSSRSMESPRTPVLARAPNSRPGLTDESVKGDEAFVPPAKRPISRLSKLPPGIARHARTRSAWSSYGEPARRELWYQRTPDPNSPRPSWDTFSIASMSPRAGRRATVSSPSGFHHDYSDEEFALGGLSPRPLISRSEIGRAIG